MCHECIAIHCMVYNVYLLWRFITHTFSCLEIPNMNIIFLSIIICIEREHATGDKLSAFTYELSAAWLEQIERCEHIHANSATFSLTCMTRFAGLKFRIQARVRILCKIENKSKCITMKLNVSFLSFSRTIYGRSMV